MKKNVDILIAEDSKTQAEQLQHLLAGNGYKVTVAVNGRVALEAARQSKPVLVISDIVMPEMDGYELCKAIKSDPELEDIPVILVTTLSDIRDIMKGLECGADNFIRKPYEEKYLISRIDYLLMNRELRKTQKMRMGVEIYLGGQRHFITAEQQQIVDLMLSVYEEAIHINEELIVRQRELTNSNRSLTSLYHVAEGLNRAVGGCEVCEKALLHATELPGVQAGWISLWDGNAFRIGASRNMPPALMGENAMEGMCECRRRFLAGELDHVANILECERLKHATGDTRGLRHHASVPLWIGERMLGIMNLVGAEAGLFGEDELDTLYGIGHQVGIALERARLHERLEELVEERTAALTAEIVERKRIQEEQARLIAIIEATPDLVGTASPDGRLLYVNQAGRRMIGLGEGVDLSGMRIQEFHPEWARKMVVEEGIPHAISHGSWSGETAVLGQDGREISILQVIIAHKGPDGALAYFSTIGHDNSLRKAHEARIVRLNRIYNVLSGINTTIVRVRDEDELFREACRIAVEHGRFIFAWIGKIDAETHQVTPVAKSGRDNGYLAKINLTASGDAPGSCILTAQALTEAKPMVCNDIAGDERMAAWRSEALSRGYRSVAVFPLIVDAIPVGVFVLYAPETDVFDDEEMNLLVEMAGDISFAMDHIKKEHQLNYLAYYDVLTGLPNRTLFFDRLNQILLGGEPVAVLVMDLERFRIMNETLGRHAGDAILRQVAERLSTGALEKIHLARINADCFGAILHDFGGESDVVRFIEGHIMDAMVQPFPIEDIELRVAVRFGIAMYPINGNDADTLFRNAEAALKKAKASGDKYLFYTPEINARVAEKLTMENKLRIALEQEQFVLYYQPKVSLQSGRISALEALIRWQDPDGGLIPPAQFIPLLEETGLILDVGRWALERAVSDCARWGEHGLKSPRIAVNVSPFQLKQKDFVSMVESALGSFASCIDLEITESLIMQDIETNIEKLSRIRKMGVEIAVDDFGTGYSSLSYIAKLPVNSLKIDRSFIVNMAVSSDDMSIVSTIIALAHSLNMKVIAEGVETREQANLLKLLKCDEIQGYLFSPAVPQETISQFLADEKMLCLN